MCSVCLKNPCDPRCPNAPEQKEVYICSECFGGIYPGDKFWEGMDGQRICKECLDNMDTEAIIELMGDSLKRA